MGKWIVFFRDPDDFELSAGHEKREYYYADADTLDEALFHVKQGFYKRKWNYLGVGAVPQQKDIDFAEQHKYSIFIRAEFMMPLSLEWHVIAAVRWVEDRK